LEKGERGHTERGGGPAKKKTSWKKAFSRGSPEERRIIPNQKRREKRETSLIADRPVGQKRKWEKKKFVGRG